MNKVRDGERDKNAYQSSHLRIIQSIRGLPYTSSPSLLSKSISQLGVHIPRTLYLQVVELTNVLAGALANGTFTLGFGDWLRELQVILSAGLAGVDSTEELTGRRNRAIAAIVGDLLCEC